MQKARLIKRYVSMLVFGHTWSMCLKEEVHKTRTFTLGPSQDCFYGTEAEFINSSILALIKPDCNNSFYFLWPTYLALERWKEVYIPVFGVLIVETYWALDINDNPSWVLLVFDLTYPKLTSFLKSSLSWWNPKTRWRWRLYPLNYVFKVFGNYLLWMVRGPSYLTPNHESTVISGLRVATSCFC